MIDKTEAWVFHVTGDDTGASAVWVAQRVPDDHVSAVLGFGVLSSDHAVYVTDCIYTTTLTITTF